jgi:pyruvate formate lyase activating enzyme
MKSLVQTLDELTSVGELVETLPDGAVRCLACAHRCRLKPGQRGICQVRFNQEGSLRVPWGYVAALQADPIEKKPFAHLLPGAMALTFGMLGCDFHCGYCQNWLTSQALRDPAAEVAANLVRRMTPQEIVHAARRAQAEVLVSSYNEPLITSEWAVSVFKESKRVGLKCAYVSNGHATPEALEYLSPYLCAYKVDLKAMREKTYQSLGGKLKPVLETIQKAHDLGLWVEVVTLVVPGLNDSSDELFESARFLASVSPEIPWHLTAFHKDYQMTDPENTPLKTLLRAAEIGQEAGLQHVYVGNVPGRAAEYETTRCPQCRRALIRREGYLVLENHLSGEGKCPSCGRKVAGIWAEKPRPSRRAESAHSRTVLER